MQRSYMQKKAIYSLGSLVLLLVLFATLSMLSSNLLRGSRFDLTENNLFTLSEGTLNVLAELPEPVTLYFYFSQEASREIPQLRSYARRVDELLQEFVNHAGGKLTLRRIDPEPFSEEEDQAAALGLQGAPIGGSGETLYLGIAASNTLDDMQVMPFLQPSKEKFLEYDLAKMISSLGNPERKKLGLLSSLPMQAGFDPATQGMRPAWVLYEQLGQLFEIEPVDAQAAELPANLDLLLLVHPKDLNPGMLYSIEQFVLGGGRLVAFLDPFAEADQGDPNDPMARMQAGSSSNLGSLPEAWGVAFDPTRAVGDLQYGIGSGPNRHIGILSVPAEGMNSGDIVSSDLEVVNLSSTGWFEALHEPAEGAATPANVPKLDVLLQSSENAAPMDTSRFRFLARPADLLDGFNPTGERYALAVRVSGPAKASIEAPEGFADTHRGEAVADGINLLLFADTDMLTDRLWAQRQAFFGQDVVTAFADNGSLAVNAVDNMLGNRDLISIRTRANSARPFERVDELRVAAERAYRDTEERLQLELEDTERRLSDLQAAKGEGELTIISDEQQAEIKRFMDRRLEIRRELRQVQHDLQRDIDSLGTRLKFVNIALVPALVLLVALAYDMRRRRRQDRAGAGARARAKAKNAAGVKEGAAQ
jgi:ABC-type uncharacterized transport system involved in gliding motility auxiliary subunit